VKALKKKLGGKTIKFGASTGKTPPKAAFFSLVAGVLILLCLFTFVYLAQELREQNLAAFDVKITGWVSALTHPLVTPVMYWASLLGSVPVTTGISGAAAFYFLRRRSYREALATITASLGAFLLETTLKETFQRPRPSIPHLMEAHGYSFPSGHTTIAAALFLILSYLWYRHTRNHRWLGPSASIFLALLIGISRLYLGVHYPSDVLAGFALGAAWGLVILLFLHR
jgi:undecaprenyl-diphosphatase